MNRDQLHGWTKQIAGTLRAHIGRLMGNRAFTLKGRVGQVIGKTQASYGSARARLKKRGRATATWPSVGRSGSRLMSRSS